MFAAFVSGVAVEMVAVFSIQPFFVAPTTSVIVAACVGLIEPSEHVTVRVGDA